MHILEPIAMNVCADLCVVDDDPRLPKTRITCKNCRSIVDNLL